MAKEKIMTFVQTRSKLSEIVDRVAESGELTSYPNGKNPARSLSASIDTGNSRAARNT